jgi:hypothetical protein
MLSGPAAFTDIGGYLLTAVEVRLRENGLEIPNRIAVVPSPIVADDCSCGLLAVTVSRIYGSDIDLQDPVGGGVTSGPGFGTPYPADEIPTILNGELQVAIMRCASIPDDGTPDAETLAQEAVEVHSDAYWVQVAVACELARLKRTREIEEYALGDAPFIGPQGGCQGAQFNVTASVPFLCPC